MAISKGAHFHNSGGWLAIQDALETFLYGLKPFSQPGAPASMEEASERGAYFVSNTIHSDAASPLYGDVVFVISTAYASNATLYSAVDTGEWSCKCSWNSASQLRGVDVKANPCSPGGANNPSWANCSAYDFTLGTTQAQVIQTTKLS